MPRRRPVSSENIFANVRTSGHLFGAIALESGTPLETAPTAEDIDYRSPAPAEIGWNEELFKAGKSVQLGGWAISWQEDRGVVAFNAQMGESLNSRQVMLEFGNRFKDGVFTLGADKQHEEAQVEIRGGWLKPYEEPQTCGVAVSRVSGSRWDARRISRSGIFWLMTPGFFALPRGRMMSPTSPRDQTSTCSPPKVHTSTHYHHLF